MTSGSGRSPAPIRAGAADVSFTSGIIPMAIDGIGAATPPTSLFPALIKRVAILLHRLGRSGPTLP